MGHKQELSSIQKNIPPLGHLILLTLTYVDQQESKGLIGEEYFMLIIDDFTRMTWVCLLKKKSEAFGYFKIFKALVENEAE